MIKTTASRQPDFKTTGSGTMMTTANDGRRNCAAIALIAALGVLPGVGRASCFLVGGGATADVYFTFTPSIVSFPRNVPMSTEVKFADVAVRPAFSGVDCSGDSYGIINQAGSQPPIGGIDFPVGNTGVAIQWRLFTRQDSVPAYGTVSLNGVQNFRAARVGLSMVKVGPIPGGTVVPAGPVGRLRYGGVDVYNLYLANSLTIVTPTCTTADVAVSLGTQQATDFKGAGSGGATAALKIPLNCEAYINTVQYRIDPATPVLNSGQSVVALDESSTASGIGVQLLDDAGTAPVPLSALQTFADYQGAAGNYSVPLRVRYYQTGASVKGGTANTSMVFTMDYR
jgi:major type 1 subunit fimbrin (pilin)